MTGTRLWTLLLGLLYFAIYSIGQNIPPVIEGVLPLFPGEKNNYYYTIDEPSKVFECKANGQPQPRFTWWRAPAGLKEDPDRYVQLKNDDVQILIGGNYGEKLTVVSKSDQDGWYKCRAANSYGITESVPFNLTRTVLVIEKKAGNITKEFVVGEHVRISCREKFRSIPEGTFRWFIGGNTLTLEKRHVVDKKGTLHIISATKADEVGGNDYICHLVLNEQNSQRFGGNTKLKLRNGNQANRPQRIDTFTTGMVQVSTENSVTIQCIPDGNPQIPTVRWRRKRSETWTDVDEATPHITFDEYRYNLKINDASEDDEAMYQCYLEESPPESRDIRVEVYSNPMLTSKLKNTRIIAGDSTAFECIGRTANNHASVKSTWYENARELRPGDNTDHRQVRVHELQLLNVRKPEDISAYACRLENRYGSTYTAFSLNVIDETKISQNDTVVRKGTDEQRLFMNSDFELTNGISIIMTVSAEPDELVEESLKYTWYHDGSQINSTNTSSKVFMSLDLKRLTINVPAEGSIDDMYGNYTVVVSIDADGPRANKVLYMNLKKPAITGPTTAVAKFPFWAIGLAVGILLLLLIIALIMFITYRNRGAIWKVDEKERKAGNDIEKELADSGFHDLGRADDPDEVKKPKDDRVEERRRSISDDDPPPMYETTSLDEYGEPDMSKFNEEGSFIDAYGKKKAVPTGNTAPYAPSSDYRGGGYPATTPTSQHPYAYTNQDPSIYESEPRTAFPQSQSSPRSPTQRGYPQEHPHAYSNESMV